MKPLRLVVPLALALPALMPLVGAVAKNPSAPLIDSLAPEGRSDWGEDTLPFPSPEATVPETSPQAPDQKYPQTASSPLQRAESISQGLPSQSALIALDGAGPRRLPPPPPPVSVPTVVRLGDTLLKIAQRHGLTIGELLQLNPGLETARLVVGSQVQVAQSSPGRSRMLLGIAPVGSGGLSWPELPRFGGEQRFPHAVPQGNLSLIWPAQGTFTSGYGWRWGRMHKGIDIANNVGTPIVAAARGRVTFAGWHEGGYGYLVEVTHDDGSLTRYGHNSNLLVREGQLVDQGQTISLMGSTGRSTGPHLHFEILPPGEGAMNPLFFLPPRA